MIKRQILIISFLFLVTSSVAYAQGSSRVTSIFFGLSGGMTTTTFTGSHIDNRLDPNYSPDAYIESGKGLIIAAQAKITLEKYYFFRSGLSYVQKGAKEMNSRFVYPFQADLGYLSVPLLFGVQPVNFDNVRNVNVYIEAGFAPNFEVSRKNSNLEKGYSMEPDIKKFLLSYQLGAGLEIKIVEGIVFYTNYSYFKDLGPFFKVFTDPTYEAFNKGYSLSGGVMVDIQKLRKDSN